VDEEEEANAEDEEEEEEEANAEEEEEEEEAEEKNTLLRPEPFMFAGLKYVALFNASRSKLRVTSIGSRGVPSFTKSERKASH